MATKKLVNQNTRVKPSIYENTPAPPHHGDDDRTTDAGHIDSLRINGDFFMQNIQQNITTLFAPDLRTNEELYHLSEQLAAGLPSRHGNALLLLKLGIPTPSAGLALPRALRKQMTVQLYLDIAPTKDFVRHERPGADVQETVVDPHSDAGGPVYRLHIHEMEVSQKHQVLDRVGH